jgi:hypothetical protein
MDDKKPRPLLTTPTPPEALKASGLLEDDPSCLLLEPYRPRSWRSFRVRSDCWTGSSGKRRVDGRGARNSTGALDDEGVPPPPAVPTSKGALDDDDSTDEAAPPLLPSSDPRKRPHASDAALCRASSKDASSWSPFRAVRA